MILFREIAQRRHEPVLRRDAVWSGVALAANIVIGAVVAIAVGRHFGAEVKGYTSLLNIGPSFIAWSLALGIGPAAMYFSAAGRLSASELLTAATVFALVLGSLAAGIGWLVLAPGVDLIEVRVALGLSLLLATVQLLRAYHGSALLGSGRVIGYARSSIIGRVAGAGVLLLSVYTLPTAVFYLVVPISLAVSNLAIVGETGRALRWGWRWSRASADRMLRYGLRSHPGDAVVVVLALVDRFAVYWLLGPTALGLYSVAVLGADVLAQAGQAASQLFFSRISGAGRRAPHLGRLAVGVSTTGLLIMSVPLILLGEVMITGLFGPGFAPAVVSWQILAVAGVAEGSARVAIGSLRAVGSPLRSSVLHLAGLAVTIPLILVLGPRFGIEGIAVATLMGHVAVGASAFAALGRAPEAAAADGHP